MKIVIIGAGFAGSCAAWLLREQHDADVTVIEQDSVAGGMLRTLYTEEGFAYEYGPRVVSVFRGTPDIIPFVRRFVDLSERTVYQGTRLLPEYPIIPFPVDRESLRHLPCGDRIEREIADIERHERPPEEGSLRNYLESTVGPTLTALAFEGFNRKFWGRGLDEMPAEWGKLRRLERIAEVGAFRLPSCAPHYYPLGGFNRLFEKILDEIDVHYGVSVARVEGKGTGATVFTNVGEMRADLVISTAPIDRMLDLCFGPLEWRGYRVETEVVDDDSFEATGIAPDGVPFAWLYTPWPETEVCRTTDFGVLHHEHTGAAHAQPRVVTREVAADNVSMYPVWWEDERFHRYLELATSFPWMVPLGRLGLYKYVTMDSTLSMVQRLLEAIDGYQGASPAKRFEIMRHVRGHWND